MQTTTNYGFNIVEGTDIVNPLTQLNPNFTALDTDLKAVSDNTVDNATCIKTGTVHAVTRTNTDAKVFRFTATGNWDTGDTMTVDGSLVSVYVSDGTAPANGCFVINSEVLAAIQGSRVTLYVNSGNAANIAFDDSAVSYTANNVQTAINAASTANGTEYTSGISVKDMLDANTPATAHGTLIRIGHLRVFITDYGPISLTNNTLYQWDNEIPVADAPSTVTIFGQAVDSNGNVKMNIAGAISSAGTILFKTSNGTDGSYNLRIWAIWAK